MRQLVYCLPALSEDLRLLAGVVRQHAEGDSLSTNAEEGSPRDFDRRPFRWPKAQRPLREWACDERINRVGKEDACDAARLSASDVTVSMATSKFAVAPHMQTGLDSTHDRGRTIPAANPVLPRRRRPHSRRVHRRRANDR